MPPAVDDHEPVFPEAAGKEPVLPIFEVVVVRGIFAVRDGFDPTAPRKVFATFATWLGTTGFDSVVADGMEAAGASGGVEGATGLTDLRAVGCLGAFALDAARVRLLGSGLSFVLVNGARASVVQYGCLEYHQNASKDPVELNL